jgi:GntR family transcriptional repressor for pyruvate dehydrogenase complex
LSLLASLHGFTPEQMFEARRTLEVGVAGLAGERASGDQIAAMAEEVTGCSRPSTTPDIPDARRQIPPRGGDGVGQPDSRVARGDGLVALLEQRRRQLPRGRDLRETAIIHRNIYTPSARTTSIARAAR